MDEKGFVGYAPPTRPFQGGMSGQPRPRPDGLGWMKRPFRPKTETSHHNAVLFLDRLFVLPGGVIVRAQGPLVARWPYFCSTRYSALAVRMNRALPSTA